MIASKKVRQEAILVCSVFASNYEAYVEWTCIDAQRSLGVSKAGLDLADAAFDSVPNNDQRFDLGSESRMEMFAEAESMLRMGWTP